MFNIVNSCLVTMTYFNIVLAVLVPDHWCYVPGQNLTNLTVEDWKNLTIPMEYDTSGKAVYSSCKMYNISTIGNVDDLSSITVNGTKFNVIDCQNGWNYDLQWYKNTIPTDQDWVCEKGFRAANTFMSFRTGEVCGLFLAGLFTDTFGRRPLFYIGILVMVVTKLITTIIPSYFIVFLILTAVSCSTPIPVIQTTQVVAIEMLHADARGITGIQQLVGWTLALSILPGVMWIAGDWFTYMLLTTFPTLLYFMIFGRYMIESPRWLLTRGKINRCVKQLQKIATANHRSLPTNIYEILSNLPKSTERQMGYLSLFSNWRLAKNVICSTYCWTVFQVLYFSLMLSIGNFYGNPLLNFFLLAVIELPGFILSKFSTEYIGRRLTHVIAYLVAGFGSIVLAVAVHDVHHQWLVTPIAVLLKLAVSVCWYSVTLQAMEMYPTCLRQTGISFSGAVVNIFAIFTPYIIYLGTSYDARLPYIAYSFLAFSSAACGFALPETLHQKLPDTITESKAFGKYQSYWGIPKRQQELEQVKDDPYPKYGS